MKSHIFIHFSLKMIERGDYGVRDCYIWILRGAKHIVRQKNNQNWPKGCIFMIEMQIRAAILKNSEKMAAILEFRVARVLFVIVGSK